MRRGGRGPSLAPTALGNVQVGRDHLYRILGALVAIMTPIIAKKMKPGAEPISITYYIGGSWLIFARVAFFCRTEF